MVSAGGRPGGHLCATVPCWSAVAASRIPFWIGSGQQLVSTFWRDKASALPTIPVGRGGEPPSDEEAWEWRYVHEQAEKERERELQAKATAEELRDLIEAERREEQLAWVLTLKESAERELAKNQASAAPAASEKKRTPAGRPSKEHAYREMLREIRAQNPESDGETEFRDRLTKHPDKRKRVSKVTARRWYLRIDAALASENGQE
jgi:hypothetical protein